MEFKEPIGKGGALIEGLKLASFGDLIGYVDADGATPPPRSLIWSGTLAGGLRHRFALAAGFGHPPAADGRRRFVSRVFSFHRPTAFLAARPGHAMRCKLMRAKPWKKFIDSRIADMAFDINLLVAFKRAGFRIAKCRLNGRTRSVPKSLQACFARR